MMASHKNIIVLTPNGRRQTVKVTPNTTLLQVLEQACSKHEFNPLEYDLRHHNKIMDVDNAIRFTGLPNNAFLEMVPTTKTRQESEVFLGVQIETGERFMGSFMPTDTLWTVLNKLCSEEVSKEGNPVVIYMRTEISGHSSLQNTNLRSLGITGGRVMLRFVHRSPEILRTQANVSAPLSRPVSKLEIDIGKEEKNEDSGPVEKHKDIKEVSLKENHSREVHVAESVVTKRLSVEKEPPPKVLLEERTQEGEPMDEEVVHPVETDVAKEEGSVSSQSEAKRNTSATRDDEPMDTTDSKKKDDQVTSHSMQGNSSAEEEIKLLPGDRSGCVFSMNQPMITSIKSEDKDLPDEFFQVTLADARILLRDLRKRREDLEDSPLLTSASRQQKEAHYSVMPCVIRVIFPNRMVLQGCFVGGETVQDIKSFVRENLDEPSHSFHLYLAPPKVVLKPETLICEMDGFPAALLYFAYDKDNSSKSDGAPSPGCQYLQSSVLNNLTSQACANRVAYRARGLSLRSQTNVVQDKINPEAALDLSSQPSTSRKSVSREYPPRGSNPSQRPGVSNDNVPRWFRTSK